MKLKWKQQQLMFAADAVTYSCFFRFASNKVCLKKRASKNLPQKEREAKKLKGNRALKAFVRVPQFVAE